MQTFKTARRKSNTSQLISYNASKLQRQLLVSIHVGRLLVQSLWMVKLRGIKLRNSSQFYTPHVVALFTRWQRIRIIRFSSSTRQHYRVLGGASVCVY